MVWHRFWQNKNRGPLFAKATQGRQMTENRKQNKLSLLICAGLVIATVIAYEPIRHNEFVDYDDPAYITENPDITSGLTLQSFKQAFISSHSDMWHPLTTLSHMLDCQLFGLYPFWHHLVNLGLHIVNSMLLLWILNSLTGSMWASAFVAAVFALHPLQVESVAWASERKTVLSGLFWFLTILLYIWYTKKPGNWRYIWVFIIYGLCIMTKPVVVTLPFVLVLLDYWPLGRIRNKNEELKNKTLDSKFSILNSISEKIPLLALSAILCVVTVVAQKSGGAIAGLEKLSPDYRVANAFVSYIRYIGKLIRPGGLTAAYPYPYVNFSNGIVIVCILLFALITALVIYIGRHKKYVITGWLWFIGAMVPMIGLIQSGGQAMADRYMYLSMVGILIIAAFGAKDIINKRPRTRTATSALAIITILSLLIFTRVQVGYWRNSITLFEHTLDVTKNNFVAEANLAKALRFEGRLKEAVLHYRNAVRIHPTLADARHNLGIALLQIGKVDEAAACFNEIIKQGQGSAKVYYDLAIALKYQGKYDEAISSLNKTLKLDPNYAEARKRIGILLTLKGRIDEAIPYFNESLGTESRTDKVKTYYNIGSAYEQKGRYKEAIRFWNMALELEPGNIPILNSAAWLLATTDDTSIEDANRAIEFSERACELTRYKDPSILDTLAAAYAASGRFEDAISTANKAVDYAKAAGYKDLANDIQERIKLYQARQRYYQAQKENEK
jgi:tetratricopeptide (TPR) repeat protein